jgi:hypothetical protein
MTPDKPMQLEDHSKRRKIRAGIAGVILGLCLAALVIYVLDTPDARVTTVRQIVGSLGIGVLLWLFLTIALLLEQDPLETYRMIPARVRERFRVVARDFPRYRKAIVNYGAILLVVFAAWLGVALTLAERQGPTQTTVLWFVLPPTFVMMAVLGVLFYTALKQIFLLILYLASLPVRFGARKLGVRGLGSVLESLGVVMIGFSRYYELLGKSAGLDDAAKKFMENFGFIWLDAAGIFCAALGGTYSLLAHLGFFANPIQDREH